MPQEGSGNICQYLLLVRRSQTGASGSRDIADIRATGRKERIKENVPGKSGMKVTAINLDPDLYIEENRLIPCALTTRFVSDVAGRISCVLQKMYGVLITTQNYWNRELRLLVVTRPER